MTPKQKAEELVDKFLRLEDDTRFYYHVYWDERYTDEEVFPHAKRCALKCVDEIIEIAPKDTEQIKYSDGTYAREYREIPNRYWNEVKKEIEKL